jgi:hypothetical protein
MVPTASPDAVVVLATLDILVPTVVVGKVIEEEKDSMRTFRNERNQRDVIVLVKAYSK